MCWIGKQKDIHVSKEDVQVFKVLYTKPKGWHDLDKNFKREYLAPYYPFRYTLGLMFVSEINTSNITISKIKPFGRSVIQRGMTSINKAIHCYSSSCKWQITSDNSLEIKEACRPTTSGVTGLNPICHYPLQKKETENLVVAVVEGIIPAGTEYWENESGEIATSRLILNNVKYMYNEKRK